ncbi:MAG TPA: cytochrome P450 [Blastocatellia bacterium]|jgi:cytochrome P450
MVALENNWPVAKSAPGPRGHRLVGSLLEVRRDRIKFVVQATRRYGDVVSFQMGPKRLYLLNHPGHARHILCDNQKNYKKGLGLDDAKLLLGEGLLTSEGELWNSQRRHLQSAYHTGMLERYSRSMVGATLSMLERWSEHARTGETLDVAQEMVRLTLSILGESLFEIDFSHSADDISADLQTMTRWAIRRMTALFKIPPRVPTPANLRARRALARLEIVARQIIDRRLRHPANQEGDMLSLLMSLLNREGEAEESQRQVRDELMTFLLAGHETTAAALTWAWYLLSRHTEVERKLRTELDSALGGREPCAADLTRLVYTKKLFDEVMRLYPPVWMIPRKSIEDDEIGGYRISANSDVLLSVYTLHRHRDFWENPEQFDPERFSPEMSAWRQPCSYLPFGAGARTCIGSRFGMMEAMLVMATIARRFRLELAPGQSIEPVGSLTLYPRHGLRMKIIERR